MNRNRNLFLAGIIAGLACLFTRAAIADNTGSDALMHDLTKTEAASVASLTAAFTPSAERDVWGVAFLPANQPFNFTGLPQTKAPNKDLLVFVPPANTTPSSAILHLMWPDVPGNTRNMINLTGTLHRAGERTYFLFEITDRLNALRNEGLEFTVEYGDAHSWLTLYSTVFSDGVAWAHVDSRFSNETIVVTDRPKDGHALRLTRGTSKK